MQEIQLETIEWSAPEYNHKERSNDWFWGVGLIAIVSCGVAIWIHNYLFAIFILISGASIALFNIRHPKEVEFSISTDGLSIGKTMYEWKSIQGFNIKKDKESAKLIIKTSKYFLPIYTIVIPIDLTSQIREELSKVTENIEINESPSMIFAEKIGL